MNKNYALLLLLSILFLPILAAQKVDLGIGIKLRYFIALKEGKSNFTASLAMGVSKHISSNDQYHGYYLPTYQVAFNVYNSGLGTNMLESQRRTQFDIVNSFSITVGYKSSRKYIYDFKSFNNMTASAFQFDYGDLSLSLASSFIINNHKRNQHIGFAGVTLFPIRAGIYNDKFLSLFSDHYDRWWTGGYFVQLGTNNVRNLIEEDKKFWKFLSEFNISYRYERFTGNVQDSYDLVSRLSLNYVPAKNRAESFNNRSQYLVNIRHVNKWEGSVSMLGHINAIEPQDKNHKGKKLAKHISYARNFLLFGVHYSSPFPNQTIIIK